MQYVVKIRYGDLRWVEDFLSEEEHLPAGTLCIVHTERGMEVGTVVVPPQPRREDQEVSPEKFVVRIANEADREKMANLEEAEKREYAFAKERIQARGLPMKLSKVDHLFGGEKIIFYFLAAHRVDFRALVRDLAKQYRTRIEMRQIGARDEAKLLGDVGHCGQELCCVRFLKDFKPVTMKMAKNQKASLDQRKISGMCGKLLCCLQYENDLYVEALAKMPAVGNVVETKVGVGEVLNIDPLGERFTIKVPDKGKVEASLKDLVRVFSPEEAKQFRENPEGFRQREVPSTGKNGVLEERRKTTRVKGLGEDTPQKDSLASQDGKGEGEQNSKKRHERRSRRRRGNSSKNRRRRNR